MGATAHLRAVSCCLLLAAAAAAGPAARPRASPPPPPPAANGRAQILLCPNASVAKLRNIPDKVAFGGSLVPRLPTMCGTPTNKPRRGEPAGTPGELWECIGPADHHGFRLGKNGQKCARTCCLQHDDDVARAGTWVCAGMQVHTCA